VVSDGRNVNELRLTKSFNIFGNCTPIRFWGLTGVWEFERGFHVGLGSRVKIRVCVDCQRQGVIED